MFLKILTLKDRLSLREFSGKQTMYLYIYNKSLSF